MSAINSFRDLIVWQKSMKLAERCYRAARGLGREDQFALGNQLRKSCVSVPSNVAEGFGRHFRPAYINHLWIANGSNNELQTQVELGGRVQVIPEPDAEAIIAEAEEVGRMIRGLALSLERLPPADRRSVR